MFHCVYLFLIADSMMFNTQWTVLLLCLVVALCGVTLGQENCTSCMCSDQCCLEVPENSPAGTVVGLATADPIFRSMLMQDGAAFSELSMDSKFVIDPSTGEVTVAENANLDAESDNCLETVIVLENGPNSVPRLFGIVVLDENDKAPVFSTVDPIMISIPETTAETPTIVCSTLRSELNRLTAMDDDEDDGNSLVSYSIPDNPIFSISNPSVSPPCIFNMEELDRDRSNYEPYQFTLVATDGGSPSLSANVTVILSLTGVNEFPPSLASNENALTVLENSSVGFEIYQFTASDNDSFDEPQIFAFELSSSNCPFVMINGTTGSLKLVRTVDAETDAVCRVGVTVCNVPGTMMCDSIEVVVTVGDVNEPAIIGPSVERITITENEISAVPVAVFTVTDMDRDFRNNTAVIISGSDYFIVEQSILPNIFIYRVSQIKRIDREQFSGLNLTIQLIEQGEPTFDNQEVNFIIDVNDQNDNKPFLSTPSINYPEELAFQQILIGVHVVDADEGVNAEVREIKLLQAGGSDDLTERFLDANDDSPFLGAQGSLSVPGIDREVDGSVITISVNITDNGTPPQTEMSVFTLTIIDINDNAPQFQPREYTFDIVENTPIRTVGMVTATDIDDEENGTVTYLLESEFFEIFSVMDSETGSVNGEIQSLIEFDREVTDKYVLTINARDNAVQPLNAIVGATVTINIIDVDDHPPEFIVPETESFAVPVNSAVGTKVGTVKAEDKDAGANAEIVFSLTDINIVSINSTTGQITVRQVPEDPTSFNLTVTASPKSGNQSSVSKRVIIVISEQMPLTLLTIAGVSSALVVSIFIILCCLIIACYCTKRRKGRYSMKNAKTDLNNQPERINSFAKPILKSVPAAAATNGSIGNKERVQVKFSDRVDETHYDRQGAVIGDKVLRKASITNFGSSDESPQVPSRGSPIHNGVMSSGAMPVMEYEHSPGQMMNGITDDLPGLQQRYEMHHIPQHSPLRLRPNMTDHTDFSQGTSSTTDVNSYNSDGEEEESTFSDGASNMNTSIPCCFKEDHVSDLHRYGPPPSHPPHYLHHSPHHMPSSNGLLGVIHPGNMSSLAADYQTSSQGGYPNRLNNQNHHSLSDSSSQSTTPSPHPRHEILNRMEPPSMRAKHPLSNGGHSYPRQPPPQLVMPTAFPHHRHATELSLSDFGENSTYASTELDEALNVNYNELEPGFYSLTATDYDEHDN